MASQPAQGTFDSASPLDIVARHADTRPWGQMSVLSTQAQSARHAMAYWRDGVLRRIELLAAPTSGPHRRLEARLVHVVGPQTDFVQHTSDAGHALRDAARIRRDSCDDISITLLASAQPIQLIHRGRHVLRGGDVFVMDYAQRMETIRPAHDDISLICSRQRVEQALGGDASILAGQRLPRRGLATLLRSHLRLLGAQMPWLTPDQRAAAIGAAVDMALAGLQTERGLRLHEEQLAGGLHQAALLAIRRDCHDPDLGPERLAAAIGCSRAALYRVFAAQGGSVAATIWATRLEMAHALLATRTLAHLHVGEVAHRCGFADQPTFNRMFKRRYGMTPLEARDSHKISL